MNAIDFCSGLILFIIIIFGIVGNALSFLVWTKGRRCRKLPGGVYLRALAVSDTTALLIPALNEAVSLVSQFNPKEDNDFCCKLEIVGRHFGLLVSSWIIVCFSVERTFVIFRPHLSTGLVSKTGTIIMMTVIFVVNFMLNLPFGLVHKVVQIPEIQEVQSVVPSTMENASSLSENFSFETATIITGYRQMCTADRASFFSYLNWYHIWFMDWVLIFIIPFTAITGCNLLVLYLVVVRKNTAHSKQGQRIKSVTMRAVTISIMHCITTGPFSISVLIPGYFSRALRVKYSQEYYINRVCLILAFLNHAMNFVLYSFFGTEFRRDCAEIVLKRSSAVHPADQSVRPSGMTNDDETPVGDSLQNKHEDTDKNGKTDISTVSV